MSEEGKAPIGRGGRGAAIMHALQQARLAAARRPGEASAATAAEPATQAPLPASAQPVAASATGLAAPTGAPPMGRAQLLARLQRTPTTPSFATDSSVPTATATATAASTKFVPGGRGRVLAGILAAAQQSRVSPTPSTSSAPSVVPGQLQRMQIQPQERVGPSGDAQQRSPSSTVVPSFERSREPVFYRGSDGQPIPCSINHVPIRCKVGCSVHEYAVLFNPEVDSRNMRFKLFQQHMDFIGAAKSFDGSKLFIPKKFPDTNTVLESVHPVTGTAVQLTLRYITERDLIDCIQLFSILFKRVLGSLDLTQIGRQNFDPKGSVAIPKHKLELWPGYITAIHNYEGGLMLAAETSHRVLRTQTVLQLMYELKHRNPLNFRDMAMKQIVGNVILTRYNKKTYRIDDILWDESPRSRFESREGPVAYLDYYKDHYNETILDLDQPLLLHLAKKRAQDQEGQSLMLCMIPELSYLTGLTDDMRSDFHVMKDIAMTTRLKPNERQFQLMKLVNRINSNEKARAHLDAWGFQIMPEPIQLTGRILRQEKIIFKTSDTMAGVEANWSRALGRGTVLSAVDLKVWLVIHTSRDKRSTYNFVNMMDNVAPQLGIKCLRPKLIELKDDRNNALMQCLREAVTRDMQMVVVVNPTSRDDRYSLIKKVCCVDNPIPSQVINGRTISNESKLRSVTQNIALQINCKLGGELWGLDIPIKKLMIVGVDVYHDTTSRNKSVLGFVASVCSSHTRWYSRSTVQIAGQEIGTGLEMCMVQCLKKYHEVNHDLPEKIIVFRDGVGDGQLDFVEKTEVAQLVSSFKSFSNYAPLLTFIVVQKRINTRIFAQMDRNNLDNPPPGTVVDHVVTKRYWEDFFLISQHVRQGTVTPTHYVVIHNECTKLNADKIQRLTYKMTHLYYNWPGTIRVPAPCQYAHKLASLIGQHIHRQPSDELCDRLFFL